MVGWDTGRTLADRFRAHAGDAQHLYGFAMRGMAKDWEAGGPVRRICRDWEQAATGSAIQLRLLAAVFRLVLAGEAPELVRFYPCLGGFDAPAEAWPVLRAVVAEHEEVVRAGLEIAPQTNEVGRSAALLAGLFDLVAASGASRVRLLELGASAGLNLLLDRFRITGDDWAYGPPDSPVQLQSAVEGPARPVDFTIGERRGCDLSPVDPTTEVGRRLLTSFVWPFDLHRHDRLAQALRIAEQEPAAVDRASAGDWLAGQLADPPDAPPSHPRTPDTLTVVWHSITQLYWPPDEVGAVESVLTTAGRHQRVATVAMEFGGDPAVVHRPLLQTRLWRPGEPVRERLLGSAHDHGTPVRLVV